MVSTLLWMHERTDVRLFVLVSSLALGATVSVAFAHPRTRPRPQFQSIKVSDDWMHRARRLP
jgi:hypothetical protein